MTNKLYYQSYYAMKYTGGGVLHVLLHQWRLGDSHVLSREELKVMTSRLAQPLRGSFGQALRVFETLVVRLRAISNMKVKLQNAVRD